METKQCRICLEEKPITSFHTRHRNRFRAGVPYVYVHIPLTCSACEHAERTAFNAEHRDIQRAYGKQRWQNPAYRTWAKDYQADKGKEVQARYRQTPKAKERTERFYETEKGQTYLHDKWRRHAEKRKIQIETSAHPLTPREWRIIVRSFSGLCAYCGKPWRTKRSRKPSMDHVIPLGVGGEHTKSNVVPCCWPCNRTKGAETWVPRVPGTSVVTAP